jgi:hypothetical protein
MKTRIVNFLEKHNILSNTQYGFRETKSTQDVLLKVTADLYKCIDSGATPAMLLVDLKKAFDTVSHKLLKTKLDCYGIRGNALKWISNYLLNRTQEIKCGDCNNVKELGSYGVPQGSVLGPILYLIYVNDLPDQKFKGTIYSFADDTALLYLKKTAMENLTNMQADLNMLSTWTRSNLLTLNAEKTSYILFSLRSKRVLALPKITYHTTDTCIREVCSCAEINRSTGQKYLGVYIHENLHWKIHVKTVCDKLRVMIPSFYDMRRCFSENVMLMVYSSIVQPQLAYGLIAWGGSYASHMKPLYRLQKCILKIICKKRHDFSTELLFKNCRVWPLKKLYIKNVLMHYFDTHKCLRVPKLSDDSKTRAEKKGLLRLPKINKEHTRLHFMYTAGKLINALPNECSEVKSRKTAARFVNNWLQNADENVLFSVLY